MPRRSDFELTTEKGWVRWAPRGFPCHQSSRRLGIFQLCVTKRDLPDIWEVDLYKFVGYTQVQAKDIDEAEQLALCWAVPIMQAAWRETQAAFRAQNRTP